jgi:hypothetical protein
MSWAFAPDSLEGGRPAATGGAARAGAWGAAAFALAAAGWFFLYATGLFTTLGSVDGAEVHDRLGIRPAEESRIGLSTIYVFAGQRLWWNYDVAVEGRGGVRLRIARGVPSAAFSSEMQDVAKSGRGRFEVVAPDSGLYSFEHELIPHGDLIGRTEAGSTRYDLSWGVD